MNIAVTNHAVERYKERVAGADVLTTDAVRETIRHRVREAFKKGLVKDHPGHPERRMVEVVAGQDELVLALGPNDTKFPGEWAVIGVLFKRELGRKTTGATLADKIPASVWAELQKVVDERFPRFIVRIGHGRFQPETHDVQNDEALEELLKMRNARPQDVAIYELRKKK
jgi:hypothetical protein